MAHHYFEVSRNTKVNRSYKQRECDHMIPFQRLALKQKGGKDSKDNKSDNFLHHLQLH